MTSLDIKQTIAHQPVTDQVVAERELRRRRLERLAVVLTTAKTPARLFETMESYPKKQRLALQAPDSPLAIAYEDATLRREGLRGDTVADAIDFFKISMREAHALLCDCGYRASTAGFAQNAAIAARARRLAAKRSLNELMTPVLSWITRKSS